MTTRLPAEVRGGWDGRGRSHGRSGFGSEPSEPQSWVSTSWDGASSSSTRTATPRSPGSGTLAYTFGLRHAFDADHIAAIDNTTRKLLQDGKRPLGVGFFFSLGHSTIVFVLAAGSRSRPRRCNSKIPAFQDYGGYIGASVSGTFLWIIGILNLLVLIDILRIFLRDEDRPLRQGAARGTPARPRAS